MHWKDLKKIVHNQLMAYFSSNNLLHLRQHGFATGRCSVTNMLTNDTYIANAISAGHPFNILTFDFKKAFVRAQHRTVLACLSNVGVVFNLLRWFTILLSERTETVGVAIAARKLALYLLALCKPSSWEWHSSQSH